MTRTWLSILLASLVCGSACSSDKAGSKCDTEGETRACECDDASGSQTCSAKSEWSVCMCDDQRADAGTTTDDAAVVAGDAASSSDASVPGNETDAETNDEDAAVDGTDDAATSDPDAAVVPPYASCNGDDDCNAGDVCNTFAQTGVCAAACQEAGDCHVPEGTYDATATCTEGHCSLSCAPTGVPPLPLSCPTGMVCLGMGANRSCTRVGI